MLLACSELELEVQTNHEAGDSKERRASDFRELRVEQQIFLVLYDVATKIRHWHEN